MLQNLSLFFCHLVYHLDSAALHCISLHNSIYWYTNAPKPFPLLHPPRISSLLNLCCCYCWCCCLWFLVGIIFWIWIVICFWWFRHNLLFDSRHFFLIRLPFWADFVLTGSTWEGDLQLFECGMPLVTYLHVKLFFPSLRVRHRKFSKTIGNHSQEIFCCVFDMFLVWFLDLECAH